MIKKQAGFTMTELLITMAIFVLALAAISNIFVPLLTQFKQQSKMAETQIEGAVGLEILRRDLEQAGFGLPWVIPSGVSYQEGSSTTTGTIPAPNDSAFDDATTNPPRPLASGDNETGLGGADYLVIKATSVATNDAAMKWTEVVATATGGSNVKIWNSPADDLAPSDRVVAIIPSRGGGNQRILVNDGSTFYAQFSASDGDPSAFPSAFAPATAGDVYLVYGVDSSTNLRMPFNRADYYIDRGATLPPRCAAGTGILTKSLISQATGNRGTGIPLLDCVADMQVIFMLDRDGDGIAESATGVLNDGAGVALTAEQIRGQLKQVRVYILAHEGQRDVNYTYYPDPGDTTKTVITVGESGAGRDFNFATSGIANWRNYRWKVYTIVVAPNNMRS